MDMWCTNFACPACEHVCGYWKEQLQTLKLQTPDPFGLHGGAIAFCVTTRCANNCDAPLEIHTVRDIDATADTVQAETASWKLEIRCPTCRERLKKILDPVVEVEP
jgi:hypothetical protein